MANKKSQGSLVVTSQVYGAFKNPDDPETYRRVFEQELLVDTMELGNVPVSLKLIKGGTSNGDIFPKHPRELLDRIYNSREIPVK